MKYSTRLSDAVHILALIHLHTDRALSSAVMAASIQTNPAYVRQLMAKLKAAGLTRSTRGQATPALQRAPEDITLLEIYRAIEGEKPLLHLDTHTNPACGIGVNIQLALAESYARVQAGAELEMRRITLQSVIDSYHQRTTAGKADPP